MRIIPNIQLPLGSEDAPAKAVNRLPAKAGAVSWFCVALEINFAVWAMIAIILIKAFA